jgi:hypothetical protein
MCNGNDAGASGIFAMWQGQRRSSKVLLGVGFCILLKWLDFAG